MTREFDSKSLQDTAAAAAQIINLMRQEGVNLALLRGDLGAGKTTFVRAAVDYLGGQPDDVNSPTFTLHNVYDVDGSRLHHYDLYRLSDPGIMLDEVAEAALNGDLVFIEWPPEGALPGLSSQVLAEIGIRCQKGDENSRLITYNLTPPVS